MEPILRVDNIVEFLIKFLFNKNKKKLADFRVLTVAGKRSNRVVISLQEMVYAQEIYYYFKSIRFGTIASKSQNLTELTLYLNPSWFKVSNFDSELERIELVRNKCTRLMTVFKDLSERIQKEIEKNPDRVKEVDEIKDYFRANRHTILTDEKLIKYDELYVKDLSDIVDGKYVTVQTRAFYSFDTICLAANCYVTMLADLFSRLIPTYLVTDSPPTSYDLQLWFDEYFTEELRAIAHVIHTDRSGCNLSLDFLEYCKNNELEIRDIEELENDPALQGIMSFNDKYHPFGNQVSENINRMFKALIQDATDPGVEFKTLDPELQRILIDTCIETYNKTFQSQSLVLRGYSPEFMDKVGEFMRREVGEFITQIKPSNMICAKTGTDYYQFLLKWLDCAINAYKIKVESEAFAYNYDLPIGFFNKEQLYQLKKICMAQDPDALELLKQAQEKLVTTAVSIITKAQELEQGENGQFVYGDRLLRQIKDSIATAYMQATTEEERQRLTLEADILRFNERRNIELKDYVDKRLALSEERMEKQVAELRDKKSKEFTKEDFYDYASNLEKRLLARRPRRRFRKLVITPENVRNYSVMPEDFEIILESIKLKNLFQRAKYRLAHVILRITGIKISNLQFITIKQLDSLFSKESLYIRLLKKEDRYIKQTSLNIPKKQIPYVEAMEKFLNLVRDDYNYIKKLEREKSPELTKVNKNDPDPYIRLQSEIWSDSALNFKQFCNIINKQLKTIGEKKLPSKVLTTISYRRGLGILITNFWDSGLAAIVLRSDYPIGIEFFGLNRSSIQSLLSEIYEKILSIENSETLDFSKLADKNKNNRLMKTLETIADKN